MKKNISINISGIIFHIEEDGYDKLKKYLDSINKYFSAFEDSSEILADIESRIAEIFLSKLNEGKQVITHEDVDTLIGTMGSVSDFKEAEEKEYAEQDDHAQSAYSSSQSEEPKKTYKQRTLLRDKQRKIFGGVCAGFAHYFNIDPVWPRVIFALLILGTKGIFLLAYFILWIVMPASAELEENTNIKKMYRDAEGKVLGGVARGLSNYFSMDVAIVRLIFVVLAFAWLIGVVLYVILWIALPEAKTITEKMRMKGEPVTLTNIESSIKKSLNVKEDEEENIWVKILLFPFRLIGAVINWIGRSLGPVLLFIVDIIRVFAGLVITFTGLSMFVSIIIVGGVLLGLYSAHNIEFFSLGDLGVPMEVILDSFHWLTALAIFLGILIPALFLILLGVSLIARRIVFNAAAGWSLFALFVISIGIGAITIPKIALDFRERGTHTEEMVLDTNNKIPVLKINEIGMDDYRATHIRIVGHDGEEFKLVKEFQSQGRTKRDAIENAQMISYHLEQQDSIFVFDSNFSFNEDAKFRGQSLWMIMYVPYNKPFFVERDTWRIINNWVPYENRSNNTWIMSEEGLVCKSCPETSTKVSSFENFTHVDITGLFDVRIERGADFNIEIKGPNRQNIDIRKQNNTIKLSLDEQRVVLRKENTVYITMPALEEVTMAGAGKLEINDFDVNDLHINLAGAIKAKANVDAETLEINMAGLSTLDLKGRGKKLEASLAGASQLKAAGYKVQDAKVDAVGASTARVNVSGFLESNAVLGSSIRNVN